MLQLHLEVKEKKKMCLKKCIFKKVGKKGQ
jgi:hypothetical protein